MSRPAPHSDRSTWARVAVLCAVALGALGVWRLVRLEAATAQMTARVDELAGAVRADERALQLYRFEQLNKTGLGMPALLEQLAFWSRQDSLATTPAAERREIAERLTAIHRAMRSLGAAEAMPRLERAFRDAAADGGDIFRQSVLRAMADVDATAAADFLERATRGLDFAVPPGIRLFAAHELIGVDRTRAAAVLRTVLETESSRGLDFGRLPAELRAAHPDAAHRVQPFAGFWNFVDAYVDSGDPAAGETLLMLLGRRNEHDLLTLQAAVKALGKLGIRDAVAAIRDLFERPPPDYHPMFCNACLDALAQIEGAGADDYFKGLLQNETRELVRIKLTDLLQRSGG